MNHSTVLILLLLVAGAVVAWRRHALGMALTLAALAVLPAVTLYRQTPSWMLAVLAAPIAAVVWHRWGRTAATVTRWGAVSRRKAGVASTLDIARVGSAVAMRRTTATVRPSLAASSRRARWAQLVRLPTTQVGVQLCRVGVLRVWASLEDVVVVFGGPRVGKTQWLAGRIIDHPGAALVTSTRTDLLRQTGPLREAHGPVYVFNPVGLADLTSTITFDPLTGCADPVTATERASDMLTAANKARGGDREFWDDQGRRNLAALMHAAALGGLSMVDVQDWLADLDSAEREVTSLLRNHSPEPGFVAAISQFIGTNTRTRTSITSSIAPALGWLTHGPARAAATAGEQPFDVAALLDGHATVYLLGGEESQVAPLVCALTGYIAREARRIAAHQPGGRLDPPLGLHLDEAAIICPVPLQRWTADMGGAGICIVACFQSRAQLVSRYGGDDAAVILNNAGGRVLFGGTADRDDLTYWSTLAGDRDEPVLTRDAAGRVSSRTVRKVPVLAPAQLANLPAGRVVVFRRGMPPVIGWAEQAWRRPDVRAHHTPHAPSVRARRATARVLDPARARTTAALRWVTSRERAGWAVLHQHTSRPAARAVAVPARAVLAWVRGLPDRWRHGTPATRQVPDQHQVPIDPMPVDSMPVDPMPVGSSAGDWAAGRDGVRR